MKGLVIDGRTDEQVPHSRAAAVPPPRPGRDLAGVTAAVLSLASSGVVTSAAFVLLSSGRQTLIPPDLVAFIVLFVQWQTLGLTVAKLGVDQVMFAAVSKDPTLRYDLGSYLRNRVLPLAVVCASGMALVFSPAAGAASFVMILLDATAVCRLTDWNARRLFLRGSLAGYLYYPLFFLLLFSWALIAGPTITSVLCFFVTASLARCLCSFLPTPRAAETRNVVPRETIRPGLQQAGNYLLFKADQLALALLAAGYLFRPQDAFLREFLFLSRFPELVSGIAVIVGTVLFPRVFLTFPFQGRGADQSRGRSLIRWLVAGSALLVLAFPLYLALWAGADGKTPRVPFLFHAILILPTNVITYSLLRQGLLADLLRNLLFGLVAGGFLLGAAAFTAQPWLLAWVVPFQLLTFNVCPLLLPTGKPGELYA